jgi:hypothetical protein
MNMSENKKEVTIEGVKEGGVLTIETPKIVWEKHTCRNGHSWLTARGALVFSGAVAFHWTNTDGSSGAFRTNAICLQCLAASAVERFGSVSVEEVEKP